MILPGDCPLLLALQRRATTRPQSRWIRSLPLASQMPATTRTQPFGRYILDPRLVVGLAVDHKYQQQQTGTRIDHKRLTIAACRLPQKSNNEKSNVWPSGGISGGRSQMAATAKTTTAVPEVYLAWRLPVAACFTHANSSKGTKAVDLAVDLAAKYQNARPPKSLQLYSS